MPRNGLREFLRRRLSREEVVGLSFTISFLLCACLTVAIGLLAHEVREDKGQPGPFDLAVGNALVGVRSELLTRMMSAVTMLGDWRFLVIATPVLLFALWRNGRHVSALLFAGSVLGGFGLSSVLKVALARARPDRWKALVIESTYSFPSGHTVMATVFFGGLAAIVFHVSRDRAWRAGAVAGAMAAVVSVAASRVYLGAHWATDTMAGFMVGLIWVVVYTEAVELTARWQSAKRGRS